MYLELEVSAEGEIHFPEEIRNPERKIITEQIKSKKRVGRTVRMVIIEDGIYGRKYRLLLSSKKIEHIPE